METDRKARIASLERDGERAFAERRFEAVDALCREALSLNPESVPALHLLRLLANLKWDLSEEIRLLKKILQVDPNQVESLNGLGDALRKRHDLAPAVEACRRAIHLRPEYPAAHNTLGLCLLEMGKPLEAIASFQRALRLNPEMVAGHFNLGLAQQALGRNEEAASRFLKVSKLAPDSPAAHEALGVLRGSQGRRREATRSLRRALELSPGSLRLHLLLADALEQQGFAQEAAELSEKAISLDPSMAQSYARLGSARLDLGDFAGAEEAYLKAISLQPFFAEAYLGLVNGKRFARSDGPLIDRMKELLSKPRLSDSDRERLLRSLAKVYDDLGDYEQAMAHAEKANELALSSDLREAVRVSVRTTESYIEQCAKTFTPELVAKAAEGGVSSDLPLFVVGLPRSGTSLLEQILSSHPQVGGVGELSYWQEVGATFEGGIVGLALDRGRSRQAAEEYLELLHRLSPGTERVVDKFNENYFSVGPLHVMLANARFLACTRNKVDNCISIHLTPFRSKPPTVRSKEGIVRCVQHFDALMAIWRSALPPDRFMEVSYEALVSDTERTIKGVIEFCGLPWDDACLSHADNNRVVATPSRWQVRQPVYKSSVKRWRRYEPWLGPFADLID